MKETRNHPSTILVLTACTCALLACGLLAPPAQAVERDLDANNNGTPDWLETAPSFTLLGHLGESNPVDGREDSNAVALTRDGQFAVGYSFQSEDYRHEAVRWGADGILALGAAPGQSRSSAQGVADDGGTAVITNGGGIWREADLPGYPGTAGMTRPDTRANASRITPDAHWAASGANYGSAMRLDLSVHPAVVEFLPYPPPRPNQSGWGFARVAGIRDDGRVIVGYAVSGTYHPIRWQVDDFGVWTATEILPDDPGPSFIYGASPDTVYATGGEGTQPIRLRTDTGELLVLPSLGTCLTSQYGRGISADGATIVGYYVSPIYGVRNFIWREGHGVRDLQAVLSQAYGLDVSGFHFNSGTVDISPDGRLINGRVKVSDEASEGYVAHLHPINLAAEAAVVFDPCVETQDGDGDGVEDSVDNCPDVSNPEQTDTDNDGEGDACDDDDDGDGVLDGADNCPFSANPDQIDSDIDGLGDACDADVDGDGICDDPATQIGCTGGPDNCLNDPNPFQTDTDGDGAGDECDEDDDNDGVCDTAEEGAACAAGPDNCPTVDNPEQSDVPDGDGIGDVCDADDDNDGANDDFDNCPLTANPDQNDTDGDGAGDACDDDDDNDGVCDAAQDGDGCTAGPDNCFFIVNPDQADADEDGIGDACNDAYDTDGDDWADELDNCPDWPNSDQADLDGDGVGDACDPDIDGDGVGNGDDLCEGTPAGGVVLPGNGCTVEQSCPCAGPRGTSVGWKNHGKYVSCVAHATKEFVREGLMTSQERDGVVSAAAQSTCGK